MERGKEGETELTSSVGLPFTDQLGRLPGHHILVGSPPFPFGDRRWRSFVVADFRPDRQLTLVMLPSSLLGWLGLRESLLLTYFVPCVESLQGRLVT